jgi:CHAT domain-containing protein
MTPTPEVQARLRQYLLGQLDDDRREEIEKDLLAKDEMFEELLIVENEVIDEYVNGKLSAVERTAVEAHFLATPERREKLRFGRAFNRYLTSQAATAENVRPLKSAPAFWTRPQNFFSTPLRMAVFAVLVVCIALGVWRIYFHQSEVDKGLVALNQAYREQRPIESRISGLSNYAPFSEMRGGSERVDPLALARADAIVSNAIIENPNATAHHAMGQVYLAKKQFDLAIKEFDEALTSDPKNAQLYSDLGAAWLEKGRIDLEKGKADPAALSSQGMEQLGRSLENLKKALELNPNLLEALFNRALCRQWLKYDRQAADDWREYLRRDPNSAWAEEATQKLRQLEAQDAKTSQNREGLLQDFLAAYQAGDDESAWAVIGRTRERKGNFIVESLLDDYLNLVASDRKAEANNKLQVLSYEARIEEQKASDRFTSDLVRFYQNATPAQRALSLQARQIAKSANDLYYKVEFEKALSLYPRAHDLFMQAGNECEALFALSWTGYCYLRIPKVNESLETFEQVSKIYGEKGYRSLQAQSLNALSDAELSINEFSKSLNYASRSLKLSEAIDDRPNVVRSYGQIVSIQLNVGSYGEALSSTSEGLRVAESTVYDPTLRWHFYHEAALAFYYQGLLAAAFDSENEAVRLADVSKNSLLKARSLDRLALLYEQGHDYERAITLLSEAFDEAQNITGGSSKAVTEVHTTLGLGQLYRETGNLPQAINYYDLTLDLSRSLDNLPIYLYQSHKGKLLALIGLHQDAMAEQELNTVISLFEEYRNKIADESYRNTFFDAGQDTYDVAVDFEYSRQASFEKAFQYAEACRARSLFDSVTKSLRLLETGDRSDNVMSGTLPLSLQEIQNSMSDKAQILEFSELEDKVVMWVLTRNGLEHADSKITAAELDQKIAEYREALTQNRTSDNQKLTSLGRELYADLITPVESRGYLNHDRQLCIVPDKTLNFLPFAALISPATGRYLLEDYLIEVSPSATIFAKTSDNAALRWKGRSEALLSVGDPRFDQKLFTDLPALPSAKREAQEVASYYQPNARLLIDDAATTARVKRALQDADIVHFATHAVADENSPLQSKLLLANESSNGSKAHHASLSFLRASDIYNLRLPRTRLVVLSACQTGIEKAYRGEGAISLARPFIAAGVPLVVASLWPVDSAATAELMISFHKHRKQDGVSTVEALRSAQLEMLKRSDQSLRDPYTWAAFVTIGGYTKF